MAVNERPKGPGYVFGVLAVVGVGIVAVVALTVAQPPPPTIAEFAPQAVERIDEAPSEQTSDFGSGEGGEGTGDGGAPTPAPTAAPDRVIDLPRVRRCVGNPPRQIEDPQSPPCVPYWDGDNGGATSKGVTANEIRIAWPKWNADQGTPGHDFASFFNSRFEFYGRTLRLLPFDVTFGDSPESQRNHAATVDTTLDAFGSVWFRDAGGFHYHLELARRKIVSDGGFEAAFREPVMQRQDPYLWSYPMDAEGVLANFGEWICGRLAGGVAAHAGPTLSDDQRVFGVILRPAQDGIEYDIEPLTGRMERCGAKPKTVISYPATGNADRTNTLARLSTDGVTSVICLCWYTNLQDYQITANNTGYQPEWLVSSFGQTDSSRSYRMKAQSPSQLSHTFGVSFRPRQLALEDDPFWWALKEADPSADANEFRVGNVNLEAWQLYKSMLLLASGIQMAGPNLTPQTFADALQTTPFPNPEHPAQAGAVGFSRSSHAMAMDGTEWWFGVGERTPYTGDDVGAICYVAGGKRYRLGSWPSGGDPFFKGTCDSGA